MPMALEAEINKQGLTNEGMAIENSLTRQYGGQKMAADIAKVQAELQAMGLSNQQTQMIINGLLSGKLIMNEEGKPITNPNHVDPNAEKEDDKKKKKPFKKRPILGGGPIVRTTE